MSPTHIPLDVTNASSTTSDFTLTSNPLATIVANEPLSNPNIGGNYAAWTVTGTSGANQIAFDASHGAIQITWYGVDTHGNWVFGPVTILCTAPSSVAELGAIPIGSP